MFGSHLSIAGGMHNALLKAQEYGFDTVQVFSKNQMQWRARPLDNEAIKAWRENARRLHFRKTACHGSYLINIASPEESLWRKSIESLIEEHQRCIMLGIPYFVMHPGAHCGSGDKAALKLIAKSLDFVHAHVSGAVTTCLEITAGQGSCIGHRLEHLAQIIENVDDPARMGVCLDTAHLFAAGYDFRGRRYDAFRKELSRTLGLRRIKLWHMNDSKRELGSRVDRHAHIGQGKIGLEGFRPIVNDDTWANTPKILETPKEKAPDGRDWDLVNFEKLHSLLK